jgi:hypothetical protein
VSAESRLGCAQKLLRRTHRAVRQRRARQAQLRARDAAGDTRT